MNRVVEIYGQLAAINGSRAIAVSAGKALIDAYTARKQEFFMINLDDYPEYRGARITISDSQYITLRTKYLVDKLETSTTNPVLKEYCKIVHRALSDQSTDQTKTLVDAYDKVLRECSPLSAVDMDRITTMQQAYYIIRHGVSIDTVKLSTLTTGMRIVMFSKM